MSMQKMVANRLLKGWLKKIDLEEGELRSSLMMYEEDGKTHLVSVTLKLNADGKVERIALWLKKTSKGDRFLGYVISEKQESQQEQKPEVARGGGFDDMKDDIPF